MTKNEFAVIGRPLPKVDAWAKVVGETKYADDLFLPRMAYAKLLRSANAHARIQSVDVARARALPGVLAVITAADLPRVKFGILPVSQDEEALCAEKVRMVGDPVAAVAAAVDEETAEQACRLIEVEYEPLPALMSIFDSLAHPEVRIHDYGDGPNVHKNVALQFGDVEAALDGAHLVREDVFFFEGNNHLPMEQHAAVAHWTADGKLTLWSSTQTPHYVHRVLAKVLDTPAAHIRVIATPVGGGFGGKTDPFSHEIVACQLAKLTGRPVKIALTREEVFYTHRGRHPVLMWIKTGFTKEGDITGCHLRTWLDGGAYGSYGVASTFYTGVINPVTYKIPVYKFEGARIFTNKPPCGPKRGHGTVQPRFALECQLDKAAEQLGVDPADLRRRIVAEPFTKTANHLTVTTIGLGECIDKVVEASGWRDKRARYGVSARSGPTSPRKRGVGIACSAYLTGAGTAIYWNDMPHSGVVVRADRSGGVAVLCGATDIGQGSDSILAYLTAEVLGIEPKDVHVHPADTSLTPVDLGSYSSRVTLMCGMAAIQAAERLRDTIFKAVAQKLEVNPASLVARERKIGVPDDWDKAVTFARAVELGEALHGVLAFAGSYAPPKRAGKYKGGGVGPSPCYSYSACVVELTVDEETGAVDLENVWIGHDIGRALNPLLVEGQVEGSVYMGIGEALMEEQVFRKNLHKQPSMLEYKSPTTLETPEIHTILVETDDPEGPFGAKEAGQGPLLPVIPAIANAIHHALGIRIDEVPITPDKILKALDLKRAGKPARVGPERLPLFTFKEPLVVESAFGKPADAVVLRPFTATGAREQQAGLIDVIRLPPFTYLAPTTLDAAARLMAEHGRDAMLVAGGTDLYPNMKRRQFEPKVLVGLRGLRELRGVRGSTTGGFTIGAGTTLSAVAAHRDIVREWPALATAAGLVSSPQLRNMGTIGGNVCVDTRCNYYNQSYEWRKAIGFCMKKDGDICLVAPGSSRCWAVSSSDTAPVLWALGAKLRLVGAEGERTIPMSALYQDDGIEYLAKRPDEIVADVQLPAAEGWRSAYLKLRRRGSFDFPVLGVAVAARMEGDVVRDARIVLGAVASQPRPAEKAAAALIGQRVTRDLIARVADLAAGPAKPLDNTDFSHPYRKKVTRVFVARAVAAVAGFGSLGAASEEVA